MSPISLDAAGFRETRENDRGHTKINGDHPLSPKCDIKFFNSFSFFRQTKRQRRGNSKIHVDGILSTNSVKKWVRSHAQQVTTKPGDEQFYEAK